MKIEMMKVSDLVPYENNPRDNDKAVEAVKNSIKEFGFKVPIVVDKDNVIVCGHTRQRAAKELGLEEVPCIIADDLTDEQIRAYRLADNKTAELAGWDFDILPEEMQNISGIDMTAFGFDDGSKEEELYSEQEAEVEAEETPESRVVVATVSAFGDKSEAFIVQTLDEDLGEKVTHADAEKIGGALRDAIKEACQ